VKVVEYSAEAKTMKLTEAVEAALPTSFRVSLAMRAFSLACDVMRVSAKANNSKFAKVMASTIPALIQHLSSDKAEVWNAARDALKFGASRIMTTNRRGAPPADSYSASLRNISF